MKNEDKQIIKDTILFLLVQRTSYLLEYLDMSNEILITDTLKEHNITDGNFGFEIEEKFFELGLLTEEHHDYIKNIEKHLIGLNSLLKGTDKVKEVVDLEQQMKKIQAKNYITVKEFKEIYGYSPEWQKNRRHRIHNALPFIQTVSGGKVTYDVKKVENWFENENITI